MNDDEFLTTQEVAEELGVKVRRVGVMIGSGLIPATKKGRDWMIRRSDLARARARRTQPGPDPKKRPESTAPDRDA